MKSLSLRWVQEHYNPVSQKRVSASCPCTHSCVALNKSLTFSGPPAGKSCKAPSVSKIPQFSDNSIRVVLNHSLGNTEQSSKKAPTFTFLPLPSPSPAGLDLCPGECCPQSARQCTPKPSGSLGWHPGWGPQAPGPRYQAHCLPFESLVGVSALMRYLVSINDDKTMHFLLMGYAVKIISRFIFSFGLE